MEDYETIYLRGWNGAIRAAARIAESRHKHWNSAKGHGVSCDVTACEEIATAIRALKGAP